MKLERHVDLFYEDGRSNKEYHLLLTREGEGYRVTAKFGPRDGTLTHIDKTKGCVSWSSAVQMFEKTEREKRAKGYEDIENSRQIRARCKKDGYSFNWSLVKFRSDGVIQRFGFVSPGETGFQISDITNQYVKMVDKFA